MASTLGGGWGDERRPLLVAGQSPAASHGYTAATPPAPPYPGPAASSAPPYNLGPNEIWISSTDDELPPPYTPSGIGNVPTIHCKVCQALINLEGRTSGHVVKCDQCQETTPIRQAPPGKKYVRCSCNCLLVCKSGARRVVCPRPTCNKVILFGEQTATGIADVTNARVICAHCRLTFLFNLTNRALARCPHCQKISSIGRSYSLTRARVFLGAAIFFLILAIIITASTAYYEQTHTGMIALYVFLFAFSVMCFLRALYYYRIKQSEVDINT